MDNERYIKEISLPLFCKDCEKYKFNEIEYYSDGECVEKEYTCGNINFCIYLRKLWMKQERENAR